MLARNSKRRLSGIIALVVAALLAPPTGRAIAAGGDGQQEGIKVHGDWTIEIRDPDGTLATRREFKNSLIGGFTNGTGTLAQLLRGSLGVKEWNVTLGSFVNGEGPCLSGGTPTSCLIAPIGSQATDSSVSPTLVVTLTGDGQALELSGHATAARASSIEIVRTLVVTINTVSQLVSPHSFTAKDLSTPIPVAAGQIIQVKVVISFS